MSRTHHQPADPLSPYLLGRGRGRVPPPFRTLPTTLKSNPQLAAAISKIPLLIIAALIAIVLIIILTTRPPTQTQHDNTAPTSATASESESGGGSGGRGDGVDLPANVTFTKHIAPIVFNHCARCHRPGEAAPFPLLTYADIAKRIGQIADITEARYMPPWKPEPGYVKFIGDRRLTDRQVALFRRFHEQGAVEGDPSDLPPLPKFTTGWQIGQPDLVLTMADEYHLPAAGADVYRNFVLPTDLPARRYVRAVEFRPSNRKVVHHTNLRVDRSDASRHLDEKDPLPGFEGMWNEEAATMGHLVGWHPGRSPFLNPPDIAWPIEKGTDLLVLAHLLPTGKPETIKFTLGLHFSDTPPSRPSAVIRLSSKTIDIPPGGKGYPVEDDFQLPVPVRVFSIRPHAHYLATVIKGFAKLPDGSTRWLIRINDWDFNWQEEYRPEQPIFLPAGSVITMQYSYDNSRSNIRNPHNPPRGVKWGPNTYDEMGVLLIQVMLDSNADLNLLEMHTGAHETMTMIAAWEKLIRDEPDNADHHVNLGYARQIQQRNHEAMQLFRKALRLDPHHAGAHTNLAIGLKSLDKIDEAIIHFRKAVAIKPDNAKYRNNLASALLHANQPNEAIEHYRQAVQINPDLADPHFTLAELLRAHGEYELAAVHYREVLRLQPDHVQAHQNLAIALAHIGRPDQAVVHFQHVVRLRPDSADAHHRLAQMLQNLGRFDQAVEHYHKALALEPEHPRIHYGLAATFVFAGRMQQALAHFRKAAELKPDWVAPINDAAHILATHPSDQVRNPQAAVKLAEKAANLTGRRNYLILDTLAAAYAAASRFDEAVDTMQKAIDLIAGEEPDAPITAMRARLELYRNKQSYREALTAANGNAE